jgi:hypothetical protein
LAASVGHLLPQVLQAQILAAGLAVALWHRQWASYGWHPTFVPVVSITPARLDGGVDRGNRACAVGLARLRLRPEVREMR